MFVRNGELFDISQFQVIDDVQYPVGWFYDQKNREAAGVRPVDTSNAPVVGQNELLSLSSAELVDGRWVAVWSVLPKTPEQIAKEFTELKTKLASNIDRLVYSVYEKPVTLAREYEAREAEAQTYKDAGYDGPIGTYLQTFASNANMPLAEATDLILRQAANFRNAEPELAELRMRKYAVVNAATESEAYTVHNETIQRIKDIAQTL